MADIMHLVFYLRYDLFCYQCDFIVQHSLNHLGSILNQKYGISQPIVIAIGHVSHLIKQIYKNVDFHLNKKKL